MTNNISISFVPKHVNGQEAKSINGVTQSVPTYSSTYYVATVHELSISATGSSYSDALDKVIIAASGSNNGHQSLGEWKNW